MRRVTGWASSARARLKWGVAGVAVVATVLAAACSDRPASLDSSGVNTLPTGSCTGPNEGCACDTAGATVSCGQVVSHQGNYVMCSEGKRTCDGTKWGACVGDHTLYRSEGPMGDLQPLGLGGQTNCTDNPCDPNCQIISDNGSGIDAGGFQPTGDGGMTLVPESGTLCVGLQCQIASCQGNLTTTLTGTVMDPAGLNPVYSAYVYVPATLPLPPIPAGTQADPCGGGGNLPPSVAYQLTGPDGTFTLTNVPAGANIPLVVQIGKWRRLVTINVPACQTTAVDPSNSRLPRNQGEGDMPNIAITANACDPMECLLSRIGIDTTEFRLPGKGGKVDYYQGGGAPLALKKKQKNKHPDALLMQGVPYLKQYDLVMLPCDCSDEYGAGNSTWNGNWGINQQAHDDLVTYANGGGRVFTSHWGREWIEGGGYPTPFPGVANWGNVQQGNDPETGDVNQTFQRGKDFATWLSNVGATIAPGQIQITPTRFDTSATTSLSQLWVSYDSVNQPADFTFNTPLNVPINQQFGRVMYTDMHLATAGGGGSSFPTECDSSPLTPQEKAAEFLLLDLGACITPLPPPAPPKFVQATFVRTFTASCPVGKYVQWRTFFWEDITPGDSSLVFNAQTGDTLQTLLPSVYLATASGASNLSFVGAAVDVALKNANQVSHPILQVSMTFNPTSNQLQAPTLLAWQQTFDCVDSL